MSREVEDLKPAPFVRARRHGPRPGEVDGEVDVLAKIAVMPDPDRAMAEQVHAIIRASAPALSPRTWYGYARDGLFSLRSLTTVRASGSSRS